MVWDCVEDVGVLYILVHCMSVLSGMYAIDHPRQE